MTDEIVQPRGGEILLPSKCSTGRPVSDRNRNTEGGKEYNSKEANLPLQNLFIGRPRKTPQLGGRVPRGRRHMGSCLPGIPEVIRGLLEAVGAHFTASGNIEIKFHSVPQRQSAELPCFPDLRHLHGELREGEVLDFPSRLVTRRETPRNGGRFWV